MKAYLGVRHSDPSRYGLPGEPHASFFLSVLLGKRTLFLRSYDTMPAALAELRCTHDQLASNLAPLTPSPARGGGTTGKDRGEWRTFHGMI
jgi:hypothetical protein